MPPPLSMTTEIGRFQIESEIGRGGMGVVYRAIDSGLGRSVAIKLLAPHLDGSPAAQHRFQAEAAAVARLKHPAIATVYEFGEHQGQPYIVFEWAEGQTLRSLIDSERRLPLKRALMIFLQIAQALDYAHQRGVIHRDLKPSNIMIGPGDVVTIIDFGLARIASAVSITVTATFLGTPRYSSPEQIRGDELDGRSDLYSAAVTLYEMLAGTPPFDEPNIPALLHKQLNVAPPPITEWRPDLPSAIEQALDRALAKQPAERFTSLGDLVQALGNTDIQVPSTLWRSRLFFLNGLVLLALLLALAFTLASRPPSALPPEQPSAAATAPDSISPPSADGLWPMGAGGPERRSALDALLAPLAVAPRWAYNPRASTVGPMVAGFGRIYFGIKWATLRTIDWASGEILWESELDNGIISTPALISSDEQALLIVAIYGPRLVALDAATGEQIWITDEGKLEGASVADLVLGENGLLYTISETGQLYGLDPWSGTISWQADLSGAGEFTTAPAVTAETIFLTRSDETLIAVNADDGTLRWQAPLLGASDSGPLLDHEHNLVLVGTTYGRVHAFFADSGALSWVAVADSDIVGLAADAEQIYATTYAGAVYAWSTADGDRRWLLDAEGIISTPPLADGAQVVVATEAGEVRFIDAASGEERADARLSFQSPLVRPLIAAGGWLFVQSGFIYGFGP